MGTNMRYFFKKLLIILLISVSIKTVWADDINLNKIVVTPSRVEESYGDTCRNVDVVTSKDIESSGGSNVSEALNGITSVDIRDYGGPGSSKTITMRGSTASQVLVMVDGRPVNSPRDGQINLSTLPLDNISQIEVLHGPASSLYGSAGMGGVVNIITKNPPKKGQKTELYSGFGTNHTFIDRMSQGARLGKFGYLINGSYESSNGFRPNSKFNSKDFNTKFEYKLNQNNNLFINSGFYKSWLGLPGALNDFDIDNKQLDIKNFVDVGWNFSPDNTLGLKVRAYNNHERLEFMPNSLDSVNEMLGYDATTKGVQSTESRGLDFQFDKQLFDKYRFLFGFNYVGNFNNSTDSAKHKYNVRAWYLDNQFNLTKDLKFTLGARVDDYSNFGCQVSPNASLAYNLIENIKVHASVSRSFRAPTFNDLYWSNLGNPNLKPEKGITAETGVESKLNKYITSGITYYWSHFTELINWTRDSNGIWHPTNIGSTTINGIELQNEINLMDDLQLGLNYSFMIAKDDKTHKFLTYQPENKVDLSLKYTGLKGFLVEIKGQFTGRRFDNANNTVSVKPFFVLGLSASKKIGSHFTYFISMDNLLNREYQVIRNYPMPGFSITNGIKAEF